MTMMGGELAGYSREREPMVLVTRTDLKLLSNLGHRHIKYLSTRVCSKILWSSILWEALKWISFTHLSRSADSDTRKQADLADKCSFLEPILSFAAQGH